MPIFLDWLLPVKDKEQGGQKQIFYGGQQNKKNETLILNFESFHEHYLKENTLASGNMPTYLIRIINKYI